MAHRGSTAAVLAAGLLALGLAGCGGDPPAATPTLSTTATATAAPPSPSSTPGASVPATPSVAPPTDPAVVLAADGIGPYVIGRSLGDLAGRSLVTGVVDSELCAGARSATATGRYASQLSLTFRDDQLVAVHTTSPDLVTPSGARVGMTLAELQTIYGTRGSVITGTLGNKAFAVRVPTSILGIVFYLDASNTTVASISGGNAQDLEEAARAGEGC